MRRLRTWQAGTGKRWSAAEQTRWLLPRVPVLIVTVGIVDTGNLISLGRQSAAQSFPSVSIALLLR